MESGDTTDQAVVDQSSSKYEGAIDQKILPPFQQLFNEWVEWNKGKHTRFVGEDKFDRYPTDRAFNVSFLPSDQSHQKLELAKGGSNLYFYDQGPFKGVVINEIGIPEATLWNQVAQGEAKNLLSILTQTSEPSPVIPVAPILTRADGKERIVLHPSEKRAAVFSRYSGLPLSFLQERLGTSIKEASNAGDTATAERIATHLQDLVDKSKIVIHDLHEAGINHGHTATGRGYTHDSNFTVEYIRRSYKDSRLAQGFTINNIPFSEEDITFDPATAMQSPQEWEPVVRLIDFDQVHYDIAIIPNKMRDKIRDEKMAVLPRLKEMIASDDSKQQLLGAEVLRFALYKEADIDDTLDLIVPRNIREQFPEFIHQEQYENFDD